MGVTDALGQDTDYQNNRLGQLAQVSQYEDQEEFVTVKDYDERALLTKRIGPSGETTRYKYDANGLPVQITDPSGKITTMAYDGNQRISQIAVGSQQIDYYYHPLGGVEKYDVYGAGEDLWYNYYSTGLTSQRKVGNFQVNFTYDTLGNRTQIADPFGLAVNYQYDSLSRVSNIQVDSKTFCYEYYADGMIEAVNYPNGLRSEYNYDNMNRLITLTNKLNGNTLSQFSYQYDGNSNIISINQNGQTTSYQYDALNRLTGINRPGGEIITYQYDSRGNRTQMIGTDIDRQNFKPGTFTYNDWDEMNSFTPEEGDTTTYQYDPEGLRTKKTTSSSTTRYHCDDNGLVIAESNATNQVTAQNIWGHKPLARKVNGSYYYYLYNGHGDVIALTDESGNLVNTYEYDEWGNILTQQETIDNPLKYCGEYYDEESGLYYLRVRYYDPVLGRFISKDSYEGDVANPLTLNRYAYCGGNPLIYFDPDGEFFFAAVAYGLAAGLGAVGVTAGTAKVADAITGTNNSSKIYKETTNYLTSDEAQKAYIQTGATVGTSGLARYLGFFGGATYLESMIQKFYNHPVVQKPQESIIIISSKNLDKIILVQELVDDYIKPGAPQTLIKKSIEAGSTAINYASKSVPKIINKAKDSVVKLKTTVNNKLNDAKVFVQQKSGQVQTYVNKKVDSVKNSANQAKESVSNWWNNLW